MADTTNGANTATENVAATTQKTEKTVSVSDYEKLKSDFEKLAAENKTYKEKEVSRLSDEEKRKYELEEQAQKFAKLTKELNRSKSEKIFASKGYEEKLYSPVIDILIESCGDADISALSSKICDLVENSKTSAIEAYKITELKDRIVTPEGGKNNASESIAERLRKNNSEKVDKNKILEIYSK